VRLCPASTTRRETISPSVKTRAGTVTLEVSLIGFGLGVANVFGAVPVAVTVFLISPARRSALVVVYVAVQVMLWPGARLPRGQEIADRPRIESLTITGSSVTFPAFSTT
jgi:hypothetical protein